MSAKEKQPNYIEDTLECVEALAKIVKANDLGRIEISSDDLNIIIEGRPCPPPMPVMPPMPAMPAVPTVVAAPAQPAAPTEKAEPVVCGNIITSPIVGTFYAAPSPDKPAFVEPGKTISAGDVVCIIESMKLMNEITSEFSGKVAEIYVKNGDVVEFGQKLMRVE